MKIDLSTINKEQFNIKPGNINGLDCVLVTPKEQNCEWNKDNLIYRSSVWGLDGKLYSASYSKFFNYTEKPDLYPNPERYNDWDIREKLDGSTLILDWINGQLNIRTRGTHSYIHELTKLELEYFKIKYPALFHNLYLMFNYTIILEHYSPLNRIILDYGTEPKLWLTGIIDKTNYRLITQEALDRISEEFQIPRPKRYKFNNLWEIQETLKDIKGFEGFALYFNDDQNIIKLKTSNYLLLHKFRSCATLDAVLDLFIEFNCLPKEEFIKEIQKRYDFECAKIVSEHVDKVCAAYEDTKEILEDMDSFVLTLKDLLRKEAAFNILQRYVTELRGFAFMRLDGKEITGQTLKKLIEFYLR